jgi:hypothetical protein
MEMKIVQAIQQQINEKMTQKTAIIREENKKEKHNIVIFI